MCQRRIVYSRAREQIQPLGNQKHLQTINRKRGLPALPKHHPQGLEDGQHTPRRKHGHQNRGLRVECQTRQLVREQGNYVRDSELNFTRDRQQKTVRIDRRPVGSRMHSLCHVDRNPSIRGRLGAEHTQKSQN